MLLDIEDMKLLYKILKEEKRTYGSAVNDFDFYLKYTPYAFSPEDSSISVSQQRLDQLKALENEIWLDGFKLIELDIFKYYPYKNFITGVSGTITSLQDRNFAEVLLSSSFSKNNKKFITQISKKPGREHFFTSILEHAINQMDEAMSENIYQKHYSQIQAKKERFFIAMSIAQQRYKKDNKDIKLKELIIRGLSHLCIQNHKTLQHLSLSLIEELLKFTPKRDYFTHCFANFVINNESISEKAQPIFASLKQHFDIKELEKYFTSPIMSRYLNEDNSGILQTNTIGVSIIVDPSIVKNTTGFRADYLLTNLNIFASVFTQCFETCEGFVSCSHDVQKVGKFNVSFIEDEKAQLNQHIVKQIVQFVATATTRLEKQDILNAAQSMKQALVLQHTLPQKTQNFKPRKI